MKGCAGGPAHHHKCPDKQEMQHQREALRGQRQRLGNEATGSWREEGPGASRGSPALQEMDSTACPPGVLTLDTKDK